MKFFCSILSMSLLAIIAGVNSQVASNSTQLETKWIEQKLNHFDPHNNKTWKMRYMTNAEFWKKGGPIFIFVGGEWNIQGEFIKNGHFYDMAKENNGYLFYTEHRYYGDSHPTSDITVKSLEYLNIQQALADLAHFIRTMKATMPGMAASKVIIAGCSYSSTMVTWFRKLYPDLVAGAWAPSAVLLAEVDYKQYRVLAGEAIRQNGGMECYNRIKNAFAEMEAMFANNRGKELTSKFKICNPLDVKKKLDVETFFERIAEVFSNLVEMQASEATTQACSKIMQGSDNLAGLLNYVLGVFGSGCQELSYDGYMAAYKNTSYPAVSVLGRQWFYQTCNEFGWYTATDSKLEQPFGNEIPIELFLQRCKDAFGFDRNHVYNAVAKTNRQFGGLNLDVTNVYFSTGQLDPWRELGFQDQRATIIPKYSHCMDLGPISPQDTPAMRASKENISHLVREWLRD